MDQSIPSFHLFPTFPEEIRLQIWRDSLPGPRIMDLKLINAEDRSLYKEIRTSHGPWYWSYRSTLSLSSLSVNHEARRTTLESYKPTNIRQKDGGRWKIAYIDFGRDTLYRACHFDPLFQFQLANDTIVSNDSTWSQNAAQLAIPLTVIQPQTSHLWFTSFEKPEGRKEALRSLVAVCMHFPALQQLLLVIDGRDDRFGGSAGITKASAIHADVKNHNGRIDALRRVLMVIEDLGVQYIDRSLPQIDLALFMNGRDTEGLTRHWWYGSARCKLLEPGQASRFFPGANDSSSEEGNSNSDSERDYRPPYVYTSR